VSTKGRKTPPQPREGWAKTPRLIWALGIGKTAKLVLAVLVSYTDEKGLCWPSQETIRRDVTGSRRGVQRALDVLEGKPPGDKPMLATPAITRLPELGPGGVRRVVVAAWVMKGDEKLGVKVRQRGAGYATGASHERGGSAPGALGVRPRGARNENQEREPGNEGIAVADSSHTSNLPGDLKPVLERVMAKFGAPA
jgi:helix-turn-helix protein